MQLHHTILEAFDGLQIQGHVAVTSRYQWCLQSSKKILPSPQSGEMFIETLPNTTASLQRSEMYSTETKGLAPPERKESLGASIL